MNRAIKLVCGSGILILASACGRLFDPNGGSRITIHFPNAPVHEPINLLDFNEPIFKPEAITAVTDVNCVALNVVGEGIPSQLTGTVPTEFSRLINKDGGVCTYPGLSTDFAPVVAKQDIYMSLLVPPGFNRTMQLLGLKLASGTQCPAGTWADYVAGGNLKTDAANIAEIARSYESLFVSRDLILSPLFNTDRTYTSCPTDGSLPTTTPVPGTTPWPMITNYYQFQSDTGYFRMGGVTLVGSRLFAIGTLLNNLAYPSPKPSAYTAPRAVLLEIDLSNGTVSALAYIGGPNTQTTEGLRITSDGSSMVYVLGRTQGVGQIATGGDWDYLGDSQTNYFIAAYAIPSAVGNPWASPAWVHTIGLSFGVDSGTPFNATATSQLTDADILYANNEVLLFATTSGDPIRINVPLSGGGYTQITSTHLQFPYDPTFQGGSNIIGINFNKTDGTVIKGALFGGPQSERFYSAATDGTSLLITGTSNSRYLSDGNVSTNANNTPWAINKGLMVFLPSLPNATAWPTPLPTGTGQVDFVVSPRGLPTIVEASTYDTATTAPPLYHVALRSAEGTTGLSNAAVKVQSYVSSGTSMGTLAFDSGETYFGDDFVRTNFIIGNTITGGLPVHFSLGVTTGRPAPLGTAGVLGANDLAVYRYRITDQTIPATSYPGQIMMDGEPVLTGGTGAEDPTATGPAVGAYVGVNGATSIFAPVNTVNGQFRGYNNSGASETLVGGILYFNLP